MTVADYKLICPARTLFNNHLCTECEKGSYYKALLKRCIKNSITASLLCVMEAYFHNLFKIYEKTIDVFVTPSAFARKKLITHGFPAYKVIHIPHFINLNIYKPEYKSGDYLIYFGRLSPEKGLITLLEAVRVLPQIKLLLVGDGPMRTKLERICKFKKIVNVEFRRHIYNVLHLHELIRNAMCSILPSEWPEVFGLQILESFALGKPVIASDIGGIKELVSNNSSGFLFKPGDKEDLKNKILMLYKNKEHVSVMGKTARAYVEEKHDAKAHYYTLMKLYESLIKA
jgi:glycosyltransferase involved in cell wall biosynthesis